MKNITILYSKHFFLYGIIKKFWIVYYIKRIEILIRFFLYILTHTKGIVRHCKYVISTRSVALK